MYDCDAEDSLELSFKKDEILYNGMHVSAIVRISVLIIIMFFFPPFIPLFLSPFSSFIHLFYPPSLFYPPFSPSVNPSFHTLPLSLLPSLSLSPSPSFSPSLPSLVTESEEPDWLKAVRADGTKGLVPANYLEMLP